MSHVKSRGMTKGFLRELRRSMSGDDRARVEAEPRDVGQQALIRGFTHVRRFVWGCPGLRSDVDLCNRSHRMIGNSPCRGSASAVARDLSLRQTTAPAPGSLVSARPCRLVALPSLLSWG